MVSCEVGFGLPPLGRSQTHTVEQKQSGLTLALSGAVGSAINTAVSSANDASTESSGRLAALQGMKSALSGVQAAQAASLAEAGGSEGSMIGVNLSYGSQSSKSTQTSTQNQSQGSQLTAGNNLNIHATGTDINVQGSQLQAGKDVDLSAARDVNLYSGLNSQTLEGKNESHGASVGVGINFGQGANGLSLNASANKGKGSETGNGTSHDETTVNAGNNLTISSGRDTTLTGAQVSGENVTMDVGSNLTLTSEQDTDNYDSNQQNASAGGSVSMSGGSGSLNLSQDKMHSTYESVQEQTGIFAGKGGFDITVGEHSQLNGAVIGSTADTSLNKLDTGTLGFSDIHNSAEYEVEHQSVGMSSGGNIGGQFVGNMANGLLVGVNGSGSDSSTTKSAVSEGTITIRDKDNQKRDVGELSRDVEHANQTLSPIFDKEKEQNRLKEAQAIGEIGSQVMDIARTQGDINGLTEAKKAHPEMSADELRKTDVYKAEMSKYGTGSAIQQGLQAATAAIQGLAGGDLAKAIAGGSAPYLAEVIKQVAPDESSRVMAHAVVAGALAAAQGNSAAAGAAGAATTALMGEAIKNALYGDIPVSQLSEEQKQTLVTLGTAAAGLAGGLTGGSSADAMAGAQAGQNEISNNMAGIGAIQQMQAWALMNSAAAAEAGSVNPNDQAALALTKAAKQGLSAGCLANDACVIMAIIAAQSQSDSDKGSAPNIGKDLTDADKAELGGTGSGTPGGWGPEDEEKARSSESSVNPENRAKYEKYVDSLRASMEKPNVQDENLGNIIDDLYRPNAKIGSGSTADAVRYEIATGEKVGGRGHVEKAETYSKALQDWLNKNPQASTSDKAAAENVLKDMQNALKGK